MVTIFSVPNVNKGWNTAIKSPFESARLMLFPWPS